MSHTFSPAVIPEWYTPTPLCAAIRQHSGMPIHITGGTPNATPTPLSFVGMAIDMFFGGINDDQDDPPIPSAHVSLLGKRQTAGDNRIQLEQIGLMDIANPDAAISALVIAYTASAVALGEICHLALHRTNGQWMRLFVLPQAMILATEYAGSISPENVARCCAEDAHEQVRGGLASILLPITATHHERMAQHIQRADLEAYLYSILMEAADDNEEIQGLSVSIPSL